MTVAACNWNTAQGVHGSTGLSMD